MKKFIFSMLMTLCISIIASNYTVFASTTEENVESSVTIARELNSNDQRMDYLFNFIVIVAVILNFIAILQSIISSVYDFKKEVPHGIQCKHLLRENGKDRCLNWYYKKRVFNKSRRCKNCHGFIGIDKNGVTYEMLSKHKIFEIICKQMPGISASLLLILKLLGK